MKFQCPCGHVIQDKTDSLPYKARIVSDAHSEELRNRLDDAVELSGPGTAEKEAACMGVRSFLTSVERPVYECVMCGRIHIADSRHQLHTFVPENTQGYRSMFDVKHAKPL